MKNLLTDLDLSEVSLVDKGANPGALITLYKRDEQRREIVDVSKVKLQSAITRARLALNKHEDHDQSSHGNRGGGSGGGMAMARGGLRGHLQGLMNRYERKHNPDEIKGYQKAQTDLRAMISRTGLKHSDLKYVVRSLRGKWRSISSVELKNAEQRRGYRQGVLDFSESIST